jgi:cysteine-rich repeat protein
MRLPSTLTASLVLLVAPGCGGSETPTSGSDGDATSETSDGSGGSTTASTGDGDATSGDGDATSGDGDGTSGDGDGTVPPDCGDGIVDADETCDDGNTDPNDGCDEFCQVEVGSACGDGALEPSNGEECDDGNNDAGDGCSPNCQLEPVGADCGDATVDTLEVCDDGNLTNGDACNPTCNLENTTTLFVGTPGTAGAQDGVAGNASIGTWCVMAADNDALWVGDSGNNLVRRVEISTATVTTIAGNGTMGDVDDPVGTNAQLGWVEAITTDGNTLWIATNRKIKAIGLQAPYPVTTVAGSGAQGVADGNGTAAEFDDLRGLTYYAGKVYLVDGTASVLRSFDVATGDVVTLAGQAYTQGQSDGIGSAGLFISPRYIASDNSGRLFIADTNGNKIRQYDVLTTMLSTFAGDGTTGYLDDVGVAARIHRPRGMTSDGTSIYFSEFNQHTVRQGVIDTQSVSTLIGQHCAGGANCNGGYAEGTGTAAQLAGPVGLAWHAASNSMFVCDGGNSVIRRVQ